MIHDAIMNRVREALEGALILSVPEWDPARAGVVKLGDLQGEPDPDEARISITIHENDPDQFITGALTEVNSTWMDEPYDFEIGNGFGVTTWRRRFTVKARCLLENTKETLEEARTVASTVRTRIEHTLLRISFSDIQVGDEHIVRGVAGEVHGEMFQGGGPPDSYDFFIKVRFEVLTTF